MPRTHRRETADFTDKTFRKPRQRVHGAGPPKGGIVGRAVKAALPTGDCAFAPPQKEGIEADTWAALVHNTKGRKVHLHRDRDRQFHQSSILPPVAARVIEMALCVANQVAPPIVTDPPCWLWCWRRKFLCCPRARSRAASVQALDPCRNRRGPWHIGGAERAAPDRAGRGSASPLCPPAPKPSARISTCWISVVSLSKRLGSSGCRPPFRSLHGGSVSRARLQSMFTGRSLQVPVPGAFFQGLQQSLNLARTVQIDMSDQPQRCLPFRA